MNHNSSNVVIRNTTVVQNTVVKNNGVRTVTYTNKSTGRPVMNEQYSKTGSKMTRTFYSRENVKTAYSYDKRSFHNVSVYVYSPLYMQSGHYGWYNSFCASEYYRRSWNYSWSWYNSPWFNYYGYYYRPYAHYVYPSEWLVDYYWSSLLSDEYQAQVDDGTLAAQQSTIQTQQSEIDAQQAEIDALKLQMKKQIEDEMAARKDGKTSDIAAKLQDQSRIFAVTSGMTVPSADEGDAVSCKLSAGDLVSIAKEGIDDASATATMIVRSAKRDDCKAGVKVVMSVEQLAEFENEFNRRLDDGAEKMKTDPTASSVLEPSEDDGADIVQASVAANSDASKAALAQE